MQKGGPAAQWAGDAVAGTDRTRTAVTGGPAVILVVPQMGENIGTAARAMLNFGLHDLRLVAPRDGWPNPKAVAAASGADEVLAAARLCDTEEEATGDLNAVYATTARLRDMIKPVLTPAAAAEDMRARHQRGETTGILFGGERAGLSNDDAVLAHALVRVPVNPAFASLNLAQAVLLMGYEWFRAGDTTPGTVLDLGVTRPASASELHGLFDHLESELDAAGFLYPPEKRPAMVRNLRTMLLRAGLTEQDVRTLRGVVTALARGRPRRS